MEQRKIEKGEMKVERLSIDFEALGSEQKKYESLNIQRLLPNTPVLARLDGRAFHTLTRSARKPFDTRFIDAMEEATKFLIKSFHVDVAYTQSDEITLAWKKLDLFDGRIQKLASVLASTATIIFNKALSETDYDFRGNVPVFDCRIWNVPTIELAADNFLWREMDATKNSVSMMAHSMFSNKQLQGVTTKERRQMLRDHGTPWEDIEPRLKRGSFFMNTLEFRALSEAELERIPEKHRPIGTVIRSRVVRKDWERLTKMKLRADVLFYDREPEYYD